MELNTATLNDFVRLAGIIFEKQKMSLPTDARSSGIFAEESIPEQSGDIREYSEIDPEEYAKKKGEGDQAQRARVQQGYSKEMRPYRFALDIGITYEMRSRNKYPKVIAGLTSLARQAINRMELDLTHRLTFGTATAYTDMDGDSIDVTVGDTLALFSTVHTLRGSSTTYRNRLANNPQLSRGALEGMERLVVEETLNMFGEKVVMPFDVLWVGDDPNTINIALELLQSTASVEGTNAGVTNVYKSKYRLVKFTRLATDANGAVDATKRKYWGLSSSLYPSLRLGVWEEPRLKVPGNLNAGEEFSTDDWNFGVRGGWGICGLSGAGIKFSSGDGVA